jgi:hypothetical protein
MMLTLKPFLNICHTNPQWERVAKNEAKEKQTKTLSKYVHSFIGVRRIPMTDYCWTRVIEGLKPNPLKGKSVKS